MAASGNIVNETIPSASTSESALDSGRPFEVFLSFRGRDTRYGFTDYLYHDLVAAGIETFRDDEELRLGDELGPELIRAIEESKIAIPVFSKHYAESKWCLRELAKIAECRQKERQLIFPIFYDVEPSDVNDYENGCYKDFFIAHANEREVQNWKNAFAMFKGYNKLVGLELMKETRGYEGELVKKVVKRVLSELEIKNANLPNNLVGMGNHIRNLKGLLNSTDSNDDVRVIGILGMSGIGKTTIAKFIYNELNNLFDSHHCFLEDVAGKSQHDDGLINLQKQLVSKIRSREKPDIEDVDKGADKIKEAIGGDGGKKVLIVLDNVDSEFQIEKLLMGGGDALKRICGRGSRFILTTTHEKILLASNATKIYKPKLMGDSDALKLFCMHAFKRDSPVEGFHSLTEEVVSNAGGLPLVLVILGSLLSVEKDKGSWVSLSKKLIATPHSKVRERLRIGYDALDYEQKQIFLDIACFFVGARKENPFYMWEDCGFHPSEGIETLVRRSLVTVGEGDNILRMHDQLIKLGRQIVKEIADEPYLKDPWKRSRLWDHDEALKTVTKYPGLQKVEALRLDFDQPIGFCSYEGQRDWEYSFPRLSGKDFAKLPKLRYLNVAFADLVEDFKDVHSGLRWLEWRGCTGNSTPTNLSLENLVILDLAKSRITDNWKWWSQIKMAQKLKVLNLSECNHLARVPHLSAFASLRTLDISSCTSLNAIQGLVKLESLEVLNMSYCYNLKRLPNLSSLKKLTSFSAVDCEELTEVQGLDSLCLLEHFDMSDCSSLQSFPNLSNSKNLRKFKIKGIIRFLRFLRLGCVILDTDYENLFSNLRWLEWRCYNMFIPTNLTMENLVILNLSNSKITDEWEGWNLFKASKKLKALNLSGCLGLIRGPNFSTFKGLERLTLHSCKSLEEVSGLQRMLKTLLLENCSKLHYIDGLGGLVSLEHLDMSGCDSIEKLPDLSNLTMLKTLLLKDCGKLCEIEGLGGLVSLEHLDMSSCYSIKKLPDLSNLRMLKTLLLKQCLKLCEIESIGGLESLERLNMAGCRSIARLPGLSNLKMLKVLILTLCHKLIEVDGLGGLISLEMLAMSSCDHIERLPDLSNLGKLKELHVKGFKKLHEIQSLSGLVSVENLELTYCISLKNTLDFSCLKNLKKLRLEGLKHWTEIRGLEELKSLQILDVSNCGSLDKIPDLLNLTS